MTFKNWCVTMSVLSSFLFQVEGNVFTVFNVGSHDLPLGEIGVKVNDNNYHVVRFTRSGGNATLQIDDYNVQTLHAQGKYRFTN